MAVRYAAKYTEVSAVLNNGVDNLLAGILRQIRLKLKEKCSSHKKPKCSSANELNCVQVGSREAQEAHFTETLLFLPEFLDF